jgi:CheY-like chemotaxis protein/HPt (histidine-containing phosphotransfer) domain-containing protein
MNGVIGMIEVLQQSSLNGPQMEMANIIRDSSFALLDVINDILDFSKIESGKLEIDHIPMRVADVVEKACGILKRMALKKKVELTLFIDPAIPEQVMGDPGRLRQILINLTNNAIKFSSATSHSGRVSVRALRVESDAEGVRLEFQIADNGIGLDEDSLARIFAPFVQADVSTTRKYGGTGLGLVISRQLAKLMGGDIRVSSAPGVGSLFSVSLPLELPPDQARDHASDPNAPAAAKAPTAPLSGETVQRRGGRILVAEDNEINQNVILHQLALLGYVADLADDGREALARWHQGNHALLLTDLQMPNMDGYELTAAIRRAEADDQHLPIVALTANALKSEELRCKAAGMDDYLTKPVLLDQLQATLEKWLPIPGQGEIAGDSADAVVAALPENPHFAVLDRTALPNQIGNDPALIAQFFKDYQRSAQKAAGEIRAAIALGNWKTAGDGAHKLKSSSRAVGALALGEVCNQLEQAGKEGHADAALLLAAEFENALAAVLDAMNR